MASTPSDGNPIRQTLLTVFVLSFCTLMFELVLSRMSVFYLNYANSFLAIPLTLFGLAVGSLRVHLGKTKPEDIDIRRDLVALTIASFIAFALAFAVFSQFFPVQYKNRLASPMQVAKTFIFVLVFMPPFFFVGKILTTLYARNRHIIGKLYGIDLFGAAAACFVTPIAFHFVDLPYLIGLCLLSMTVVCALAMGRSGVKTVLTLVAINLVILPVLIFLEGNFDMSQVIGRKHGTKIVEIAHRWNEYSRVSLLRAEDRRGNLKFYRIIHDNAESNVFLDRYDPDHHIDDPHTLYGTDRGLGTAVLLDRPHDEVLVMFAGCGAQMVKLNELGIGKKRLAGVEINQLVIDFALDTPEIRDFHMREFYDLPNVDMVVMEGRRYLDTHPQPFDLIYVANNSATAQYKSGHSRKYLDTKEAMASYLDHLKDDGIIQFRCQPIDHHLESLKALYAERGLGPVDDHVMIFAQGPQCIDMLISQRPFTTQDNETMKALYGKQAAYIPGLVDRRGWGPRVRGPVASVGDLVTDDRPYIDKLDFGHFHLFPSKQDIRDRNYYRSWIKIATLAVVAVILTVMIAGLYGMRVKMPPWGMMVYLLITGFCYMLVEIAFIGKLDLFLENPLYAMALLLSLFLLYNAVGSNLYQKYGERLPMTIMPLVVAGVVLICLWFMDWMISRRLGMPLPLKVLLTAVAMAPVGTGLGLFYPYVVSWLTRRELHEAVPITYGISTLSSVAGATYAMTLVINQGYTSIVYQAIVGYAVLTVLMVALSRLMAKSGA